MENKQDYDDEFIVNLTIDGSPYEEVELALKPVGTATGADSAYEVIIRTDGQEQERVLFRQPAAK